MACIFMQGLTLEPFLPAVLFTATWAATYAAPLPPIDIIDLAVQEGEECNPPVTRVPRGRPKKERIQIKEARAPRGLRQEEMGVDAPQVSRLLHRCGACGEPG